MSSGKAMPVDPDQVPYWARQGAAGKVVTQNGEVYSCDFEGDPQSATGVEYVSHFSTCPYASQHRKIRER